MSPAGADRADVVGRLLYDFNTEFGSPTPRAGEFAARFARLLARDDVLVLLAGVYGRMGLLDGLPATNRKEPDKVESGPNGKVPIDRLADIAPAARISRARVVDAGRIITAGGITSGMEMGFHLLRRAGWEEPAIAEVARVMEYSAAYDVYRDDRETAGS